MTVEALEKLVAAGESGTVEFKESTGQKIPAAKTLCAFLNGRGGTVVFGVSRKGALVGQIVADSTQRDLAAEFVKFEPGYEFEVEYIPVDEKRQAIVVSVPAGKAQPYQYDGRAYRRVESTTSAMPQASYEAMLKERGGFRSKWESEPNPELSIEDLDLEQIKDTARRAVRCGRLAGDTNTENVEALLDGFKLRKKGVLLNGAAVLFGRPEKIDYPQLEVKMGWFRGEDDQEFLDNRHVQGNVFKLIDESMAFCFKHLNLSARIRGKIEREEELEIPADALREVLINAFAHRSYEESNRTVYLAIYDDRVEIKNPGKFPVEFDVDHLYSPPLRNSLPRNEKIARVLYLRKTIETWGRGLTRIVEECNRVGLPLPTTTVERGNVITVFKRPGSVLTGTKRPVTGTKRPVTGTDLPVTGTNGLVSGADAGEDGRMRIDVLLKRLPRLRKDALENVETVLREIIADNTATIPQICARTGMAFRTINNALATLREAGIIKMRAGGKRPVTDNAHHKSPNKKRASSVAKSPNKSVNKSLAAKRRAQTELDRLLPSAMRADARKNMLAVFGEIFADRSASIAEVQHRTGLSNGTVKEMIAMLKEIGGIFRVGAKKNGHWMIAEQLSS